MGGHSAPSQPLLGDSQRSPAAGALAPNIDYQLTGGVMLRGRLGLDTARIPHADRHGLLWLSRGALTVRDGTLRFE